MIIIYFNFRHFLKGIQMLFRIVTGEDWNRVLHDSMESPACTRQSNANFWETDCGDSIAAIAFFTR